MDKEDAKALVKKLIQAAFNAGNHSAHPEGLMAKSETKKAMDLGDRIVRYLTTKSSRH